ncbi:MAG: hypothetical protein H6569_07605 [Lewinellaceae bacterium]|nr:hypothetical protein [Lewinellaceae bacterium]
MKYQELIQQAEAQIEQHGGDKKMPWIGLMEEFVAVVKKTEKKAKKEKDKSNNPERTIETMFRVTATNSQRLSDQADSKANIMISVNTVLIPALFFLQNLENSAKLAVPIVILLAVNLLTIVFAILATRPQIPKGVFNQKDLDAKKADLLFFGNFYKMSFNEYSEGMFRIMGDRQFLHTTLLLDIYNQGIVLGRKYRMLTISYNVFMFGLILAVLAFFIVLNPNFLH